MSLLYKLLALFFIIAVVPLSVAGVRTFQEARQGVVDAIVDKMTAIADVQKKRMRELADGYMRETNLITSDARLKQMVVEYHVNKHANTKKSTVEILNNLMMHTPDISTVTVYDNEGSEIISTNSDKYLPRILPEQLQDIRTISFFDAYKDDAGALRLRYISPLLDVSGRIGTVELIVSPQQIFAVTEDYTGLNRTGEVTLGVAKNPQEIMYVTPVRFNSASTFSQVADVSRSRDPMVRAVSGDEEVLVDASTVDYRDIPVFAVTRFIPELGWGMVVKIDQQEALRPVAELMQTFGVLMGVAVLFALIAGFVFARRFLRPIFQMSRTAKRLEQGDYTARIVIKSHDELGTLGRVFNSMTTEIEKDYALLEQRVQERTRDVENAKAQDEAILTSIGDGVIATDTSDNIIFANTAFEKMFSVRESDILGNKISQVIPAFNHDLYPIAHEDRADVPELVLYKPIDGYIKHIRKDGSVMPVAITVAPIMLQDDLVGAVGVFRDITQEQKVSQMKTDFVSLVSHQLRTPLSTINWYVEMLQSGDAGKLTKEQKEFLLEVQHGSIRMVNLVNELLNVTRLEHGKLAFKPMPMHLENLIIDIIKELEPMALEKKCIVAFQSPLPKLPELVSDEVMLRQVIHNVMTNAVKYSGNMDKGQGKVLVVIEEGANKEELVIKVTDNGIGIPKDAQSQIFDKCFRAENAMKSITDGNGLGLYLVKMITEALGGRVWFESEEGVGSTFYIAIPKTFIETAD